MTFFSSDFHFGHKNIIKYCGRPFRSVHEMNSVIIDNINRKIKKDDTFYILGDFCFGNPQKYLQHINCKNIILIIGNHDSITNKGYPKNILIKSFKEVHQFLMLNLNGVRLSLFHYPMESWHNKTIHLHGHSHNNSQKKKNRIDVGVDCHNFQPLSIEEILEINNVRN